MSSSRRGVTLPEVLLVLVVLGLLAAIGVRGLVAARDASRVRGARQSAFSLLVSARDFAIVTGHATALRVDEPAARLVVHLGADTLEALPLGARFGVAVTASRDSIAWSGDGLGVGAANTRLVFARGGARDTIDVSREGRVR